MQVIYDVLPNQSRDSYEEHWGSLRRVPLSSLILVPLTSYHKMNKLVELKDAHMKINMKNIKEMRIISKKINKVVTY